MYLAMGCIIPYYVMKHSEEEQLYQRSLKMQGQQYEQNQQHIPLDPNNPKGYRRRAFFEDLNEVSDSHGSALVAIPFHLAMRQARQKQQEQLDPKLYPSQASPSSSSTPLSMVPEDLQLILQKQRSHQQEILANLTETFAEQHQSAKLSKVKCEQDYESLITRSLTNARKWVVRKIPPEFQFFETRIPGTRLDTVDKTRMFRLLMDQALNKGRWVYEPLRDYPDFGGATGWNKKMKNERDRDVAIDRPPFPEAGKYHWEPIVDTSPPSSLSSLASPQLSVKGWHADRIYREDFCKILGARHIVLVGDLIHWQLHDSIMYNMFDTPQVCYGDMACHLGVGHPLCPLPNDVRLKFVRNDLLSTVRPRSSRMNETKTQNPVEMPWLRDMKLKDTVILGATHQTMTDNLFLKRLSDAVAKIRKAKPDALIIYRNNPVGHPGCPSKANDFNSVEKYRRQRQDVQDAERQQPGGVPVQNVLQSDDTKIQMSWQEKSKKIPLVNNQTTYTAQARPFDHDVPLGELLEYPLNWAHYDRQNKMAKDIVEASGGIYWNVATMTNMRPDGHVGGQDCLSYKRPGPTDEWAVSLYNLFKTIDIVEQEFDEAG
ncbi:hypothetical protein BGZ98_000233 [Dissophora globulifera]|nr:hypothetical protein BGZ98_000233 [Dissophora globulifera]